jgi:hypothetical protein
MVESEERRRPVAPCTKRSGTPKGQGAVSAWFSACSGLWGVGGCQHANTVCNQHGGKCGCRGRAGEGRGERPSPQQQRTEGRGTVEVAAGGGKVCSIRIAFNFLRPAAMFSNRPGPRLSRSLVQGNFCLKAKLLNLRYFRTSLRKDQWNTRVFCVTLTCVSVINKITTNNCDCCVLFLFAVQAEWGLPDLCYLEEGSAVRSHALTSRSVCSRVALIS